MIMVGMVLVNIIASESNVKSTRRKTDRQSYEDDDDDFLRATRMTSETQESAAVSNVETEYLEINSKGAWAVLYQRRRTYGDGGCALMPLGSSHVLISHATNTVDVPKEVFQASQLQHACTDNWLSRVVHCGPMTLHIRNECGNFDYTCNESKKPQNRNLNRYRDVAPYDHTRIVLKKGPYNYINANLIQMDRAHRQYILTQGPLPNTAGHFWLMVWEQNSKAVLMLNKVIEKNLVKCHQYWPLEGSSDHTMMFPDVGLKVEYISTTESSDYTTRTLRLTDVETKESRNILHFHYTTWPDFGVPQSPTAFLRFLVDVRQSGALDQNVGPPVVHCSAGIGRSGTFCLVDTCLILIEENGLNSVNVRDVLMEMRRFRMGLIQTPDQLRFSYAAIIEGAKQLPSNNVNVDNNDIVTNHYDTVNNVSNSSLEEDDEPPPLPPPRGESLARSLMADLTPSPIENDEEGGPPDKPLPREPPTNTEPSTSPPPAHSSSIPNNIHEENDDSVAMPSESSGDGENSFQTISPPSSPDAKNELRQRHQEKKERLAAQVREMKRRQKQSEEWQKLKRSLFKPVIIGIGTAVLGGGVIALCGYLYMRG